MMEWTFSDKDIETAAEALFNKIWPNLQRYDGKNTWDTTENSIRQGFRDEVVVVLKAIGMKHER